MKKMDTLFLVLGGVLIAWFTLSALNWWREQTGSYITEQVLSTIVDAPMVLLALIWLIVSTPFIFLWKFFRNTFRGVTVDTWERVQITKFWKIGNLRLCFDPKARALVNKVFLVRIVRPQAGIIHTPVLRTSDKPSSPDGDFR
jgi:hypothetical protein